MRLEDLDYEDMRNGMTFCVSMWKGRKQCHVPAADCCSIVQRRTINSSTSDTGGPFIPANDDRKGAGKVSTKERNSPANTASAAMSTAALIAIIASASTCLLLLFIGVLFFRVRRRSAHPKGDLAVEGTHAIEMTANPWIQHLDATSGHIYYSNAQGETRWDLPPGATVVEA